MNDEKWISRDYIVAWVATFLHSTNFYLFMVTTSGFAIRTFGVSPALAGLSVSIAVLSAILTRLVIGRLIFRIGCIRALTIGLIAGLAVFISYFFVNSFGLLLAVRFVHGISIGVSGTALFTVASVLVPRSKSGVGMGFFSLSVTLGTAIGPFLSSALTRAGNYTVFFTLAAVIALLDLCLVPFIGLKKACLPEPDSVAKPIKGLSGLLDTRQLPVALICTVVYLTYGCIVSFLSVSSRGTRLESAVAYFFVFYAAGIVGTRFFTGRVFDRRGENPVMYAGLAIFAVGMLLTGTAKNGATLLLAAFLDGAGLGAAQSITLSIGVKYAAPERLGLANTTFYNALDVGLTLGPILGGLLVPYIGYSGTYTLGMPVALAGILLYYLIHGRYHRQAVLHK